MQNYVIEDRMGGEYSANPGDYFYLHDDDTWVDCTLVKIDHAWRTSTGGWVYAPRMLKHNPTLADLRRLECAIRMSLVDA